MSLTRALFIPILGLSLFFPLSARGAVNLRVEQVSAKDFPVIKAYVSVADGEGRPIAGLPAADFRLLEDAARKPARISKVVPFEAVEEGMAILFLLNAGGTMEGTPLALVKDALKEVLTFLSPKDRVAVMAYHSDVETLSDFTKTQEDAKTALDRLQSKGVKAVFNYGLWSALAIIAPDSPPPDFPQRRVLVVVSDGKEEDAKERPLGDSVSRAKERSVPIYTVAFSRLGKEHFGKLKGISQETGGMYLEVQETESGADFAGALQRVMQNILGHYLILFKAKEIHGDGRPHAIEVSVAVGQSTFKAARGFYVPKVRSLVFYYIGGAVVLLIIVVVIVVARSKGRETEEKVCPNCGKKLLEEWSSCPFCPALGKMVVLNGPRKGEVIKITQETILLGSGEGCQVRISHATVSRRHASIRFVEGRVEITDLNSTNGTFVNGKRIGAARFIGKGDVIKIGEVEMRFEI